MNYNPRPPPCEEPRLSEALGKPTQVDDTVSVCSESTVLQQETLLNLMKNVSETSAAKLTEKVESIDSMLKELVGLVKGGQQGVEDIQTEVKENSYRVELYIDNLCRKPKKRPRNRKTDAPSAPRGNRVTGLPCDCMLKQTKKVTTRKQVYQQYLAGIVQCVCSR